MGAKKVKIEFEDEQGAKYSVAVEGSFSKEKINTIMDLMELLGGGGEDAENQSTGDTISDRIFTVIDEVRPFSPFLSTDMRDLYEDRYSTTLKHSTVSTYLQRFVERGLLERRRTPSGWSYKRTRNIPART